MRKWVWHGGRMLAVAVLFGVVATQAVGAATQGSAARFQAIEPQDATAENVLGLSDKTVMAIVQVSGDPVTVADAKAGRNLSPAQKKQLKDQLRQKQGPVADRIRGAGGKVEASYQSAYNGIRVSIKQSELGQLKNIPDVVGVHVLRPISIVPNNIHGIPLIGAPQVWDGVAGVNGIAGEGIKIADIDTGIDYTHADFGGPGTRAAYQDAHAHETDPADPALFGPNAPRVKGGTDLVGDSYNADPKSASFQPVPHPDPNPLDCFGHGTHTAGTAAGSGVLSDGTTYTGPYNATTVSSHQWLVGPGAAPKADIYAVRVFGCAGSSDVVVDGIEWAVDHNMDVINMSLGSPYGGADDPTAVASNNAANDGIIVVASAGNNGQNPYVDGSPATASGAISVAASDPTSSFPGATVALSTGPTLTAINANGIPFPDGLTLPVKVLRTAAGGISLGCDPAEYTAAGVAGKIVVVRRGTCARVARAIYGQKAGAAAVIMVNNANNLPPFEGPITSNPDTGEQFTVTIPFLGVRSSDGAALLAADGGTASLTSLTIANPGYLATASFSSGGPRSGDSALKPDVTAPGVSIASAGMGTGNAPVFMSGTSMAAPHTTGTAALVREAHPTWGQVRYWKAAIVNTADPALVAGYSTRVNGSGFVQAQRAVATNAVAFGPDDTASLSYGFAELGNDYSKSRQVTLRNFANAAVTFTIGHNRDSGSPHSITTASSITVPANGIAKVAVALNVPAATAGDSSNFHDVAGLLTFTPTNGANNGIALDVPYYLVPQATSKIKTVLNMTQLQKTGSQTATITNTGGATTGTADWYSLGITDPQDGTGPNDIRAVGVQTFPGVIAFGLSTFNRWSNAASQQFNVYVDVNNDNHPDYAVVGTDLGLLTGAGVNGLDAVAVFDLRTGAGSIQFLADAPMNSTTIVLPVLISQLCASGSPCLSAANPRFTYSAQSFGDGPEDDTGTAKFNAFTPSLSTGMFDVVAPNGTATEQLSFDAGEFALTPSLGSMVISHDNTSSTEAQLLTFKP